MHSLNRYEMFLAGSLAVGAALGVEGCKSTVENTVAETRDELGDGKYISIKGKQVEYDSYIKEGIFENAERALPLLSKVETALAESEIMHKDVTIDFEQLKKDVEDIKTAAEEGKLTIVEKQRVWQALGQLANGLESAMRQDGLDIMWLRDEQELRINPAARTLPEIPENEQTKK